MRKPLYWFLAAVAAMILVVPNISAQEKDKEKDAAAGGMPPALIVVDTVGSGTIAPDAQYVGTVFYKEMADVAAEVEGKVNEIHFDEGRNVKAKQALVTLDTDLLSRQLDAMKATYGQAIVEAEQAQKDYRRLENLYKEDSIAEQVYEEARSKADGLAKRAESLEAQVSGLQVMLGKKTVRAPFDGIIIKRMVDKGEWVGAGDPVATIANDSVVDIDVEVPESTLPYIKRGTKVTVVSGRDTFAGEVFSVIPSGDVATRLFPVKIRAKNVLSLVQGMEARVIVPVGEKVPALIVNRDAVVSVFGMDAIFIDAGGTAKMIPVKVVGYREKTAGVLAEGLEEGMKVVVKGQERLQDGQPVVVTGGEKK